VLFFFANINSNYGGHNLARSNYKFQKRQKELARKKKKEEKRQRKQNSSDTFTEENPDQTEDDTKRLSVDHP
jgi:phage protein D